MSAVAKILIVEDERALALALAAAVRQCGAVSELAPTAAQARRRLMEAGPFDGMILDIGLPDQNGLDFLAGLPESGRLPTLVVTAHGGIENAIAARRIGVREFFPKPLDFTAFSAALVSLIGEGPAPVGPGDNPSDEGPAFIGAAAAMRPVFQQIAHACASDEPVMIRGGTGTGKTRVAHLIASQSGRQDGPRVRVEANGDLGTALERARGGVLVIEDVLALDAVGQGLIMSRLDAAGAGLPRILATSATDPREAVERGDFRSDLYYRLQVLEVRLPLLRERIGDLPVLTDYFAGQVAPGRRLEASAATLKRLAAHDWPGNLRELRNVVSYAVTAGAGARRLEPAHLPAYLGVGRVAGMSGPGGVPDELCRELSRWAGDRLQSDPPPSYDELSEVLEAELIRELLRRFDGKLARMAAEMKANRATLRRKLRME